MKHKNIVTILAILIAIAALAATSCGILSREGAGQYEYRSIRGQDVTIYGKGLYKHMSADVAIQGIAQDYITLFAGIPLLLISVFLARKGLLQGLFLLSGTLAYFLVTYIFYTAMAMYNRMFIAYVFLAGTAFFAFILTLPSYNSKTISFRSERLMQLAGGFLVLNSVLIALLWLSVIVPPLLNGSIIPAETEHYTTLIVQGFDLGLLLPMAFIAGLLAVRKKPKGYLFTTIYMIFLAVMMTALTSKVLFMASAGADIVPAVFVIPAINVISVVFSFKIIKDVRTVTC